jgi:hypothetical protein
VKDNLFVEKSEIVREILAYLAEHPDAQDTLDGIVQWWLLERKIRYHVSMVKDALAELVQKGLLIEIKGKESHTRYQLNQKR